MAGAGASARRQDIDALKLVGCFFVVMYHLQFIPSIGDGSFNAPGLYVSSLMATCVPLFFFSSGVLYSHRMPTLRTALGKAGRLLGLLLFWAVVASVFTSAVKGQTVTLMTIIRDTVTLRTGVSNWLWFLPLLAALYVSAPFLAALRDADRSLFGALVVLLCVGAFGADLVWRLASLADAVLGKEFATVGVDFVERFVLVQGDHPEALAYFAVGMWAGTVDLSRVPTGVALVVLLVSPVLLAAFGVAVSSAGFGDGWYDVVWGGFGCVTTLAAVLALYVLAGKLLGDGEHDGVIAVDCRLSRAVSVAGREMFAVYALHSFLRFGAYDIIMAVPGGPVRMAVGACCAAAIVALCVGTGVVVRRTPLRALFGA